MKAHGTVTSSLFPPSYSLKPEVFKALPSDHWIHFARHILYAPASSWEILTLLTQKSENS